MAEQVEIDVRDTILSHLKEDERDLAWLARKTDIPYATLYSIFIQRTFNLNEERLEKINEILGTTLKVA